MLNFLLWARQKNLFSPWPCISVFRCSFLNKSLFAVEMDLDNSVVEDFLSEVVIMRKLNHPNVMKLLGVTVQDDKPCVVMPLMMTDLKVYLKQNKMVRTELFICCLIPFLLDKMIYFIFSTAVSHWKPTSLICTGSCTWYGVFIRTKCDSSWLGCQKLHVSSPNIQM